MSDPSPRAAMLRRERSCNRPLWLAAWILLAATSAAQTTYMGGAGIPFLYDPTNPDLHSGWHLNFNNDLFQNWGELYYDIGVGAYVGGACDTPVASSIQLSSYVAYPTCVETVSFNGTPVSVYRLAGKVNRQWFSAYVPDPTWAASQTDPDVAVVYDFPTRTDGSINTPFDRPPELDVSQAMPWLQRGCAVVRMADSVYYQPLVFSVQQGVMIASLMRAQGYNYIVRTGGSYGAGVGLASAALAPDVFDAVYVRGTPTSYRHYEAWHALIQTRRRASGLHPLRPLDDSDLDNGATIARQYGLSLDALDLLHSPGNFRIPMTIVDGRDDRLIPSRDLVDATKAALPAWIDYQVIDDSGHGETCGFDDDDAIKNLLIRMRAGLPCAPGVPPHVANATVTACMTTPSTPAYAPDTTYDDFLLQTRASTNPNPTYISSPTFSLVGLGTELGLQLDTAVVSGDALYVKSLEGYVRKFDLTTNPPTMAWSTFTGVDPKSLTIGSGGAVLVGDMRGIHYLNPATGAETAFPGAPVRRDVTAITSGSISGWSFGAGPHVAYIDHGDTLVIEDAGTRAELFKAPIGMACKLMIRSEGGKGRLYASLAKGHIARFGFPTVGGVARLVVEMTSEYLEYEPRDFEFVSGSGGSTWIVCGGSQQNTHVSPFVNWLTVLDTSGARINLTTGTPIAIVPPSTSLTLPTIPSGCKPSGGTDPCAVCQEYDSCIPVPTLSLGAALGRIPLANSGPVEHIAVSGSTSVIVNQGALYSVDLTTGAVSSSLTSTPGGAFVLGSIGGTDRIVQFTSVGGIRFLTTTGSALSAPSAIAGRLPTTAVDVRLVASPASQWELAVLERGSTAVGAWKLRRFNLATGAELTANGGRTVARLQDCSSTSVQVLPKQMRRTADTDVDASYELFEEGGDVMPFSGSPSGFLRAARKWGLIVASSDKANEHNWVVGASSCSSATSLPDGMCPRLASGVAEANEAGTFAPIPSPPSGFASAIGPFGVNTLSATEDAALKILSLTPGGVLDRVLFGSQSGNVFVGDMVQYGSHGLGWPVPFTSTPVPNVTLRCADIAACDADGNTAAVGAIFASTSTAYSGKSVFLLDVTASSVTVRASYALGRVTGLRFIDINGDGTSDALAVGEAGGKLSIYKLIPGTGGSMTAPVLDTTARVVLETGFYNVGDHGTIWFLRSGTGGLTTSKLVFTHSGGVECRDLALPYPLP